MYNNPYFNQGQFYTPMQRYQAMDNVNQPVNQQNYVPQVQNNNMQSYIPQVQNNNTQRVLLGKSVDSVEVVKAMDIPLDGSTSYFPLTDGSAIVTKKLGMNGSSEIVVYEPVVEKVKNAEKDNPKYVTESYFSEKIGKLDNSAILSDLLDEMKGIKQELKDFKDKSKQKEK